MDGNNHGDRLANDIALEMGAVILLQFAQIAAAMLFDMEEGLGDGHGKKKRWLHQLKLELGEVEWLINQLHFLSLFMIDVIAYYVLCNVFAHHVMHASEFTMGNNDLPIFSVITVLSVNITSWRLPNTNVQTVNPGIIKLVFFCCQSFLRCLKIF